MLNKINFPFSLIAFIAFVMIYPLDAMVYIGSFVFVTPPIGMMGFVVGFLLIPFFIIEKRPVRFYYALLIYLFLVLFAGLLIVKGDYFIAEDLWIYFRLFFLTFVIGYYTMGYFDYVAMQKNIVYAFLLSLLIGVGVFVIYHSFSREVYAEANYLRFSESIALTGLVLLVLTEKTVHKVILASMIIVILFLAESRFSLFAFILSSSFYFFLVSRKFFYYFIIIFLGILLIVLLIDADIILGSRYYRLIFNPSEDTSLIARQKLFEVGYREFFDNPIWGKFGYYREECSGCYVHNFLSFLFEFGVIGFTFVIFIIGLTLSNLISSVRRIVSKKLNGEKYIYEVFTLFSIYILCGILFSKHWHYTSFYLLAGASFFMLKHRLKEMKPVEK